MVLLIDTNVVMDVVGKREPFYNDSSKVLSLCETRQVKGYFSCLSFSNVCYACRPRWTNKDIEYYLNVLSRMLIFSDLDVFRLREGYLMNFNDYEDAVQAATAEYVCADYIVTRNVKDFKKSNIKAITPSDLLKIYDNFDNTLNNKFSLKAKVDYEIADKHFKSLNKK